MKSVCEKITHFHWVKAKIMHSDCIDNMNMYVYINRYIYILRQLNLI